MKVIKIILFLMFLTSPINCDNYKSLFIGDSNINFANIENIFEDINATHISKFGGDTQMVLRNLKKIDEFIHKDLEKIFLLIGTNDLFVMNLSEKELVGNLFKILDHIKSHKKNFDIYIYTLLPRYEKSENTLIISYNKLLKRHMKYWGLNNIYIIDTFNYFFDEESGSYIDKYYMDTIHLNKQGYEYFKKITYENL